MRVYLAAPYRARATVKGYARRLETAGVEVTSTWLEEPHAINAGTSGAAPSLPDAQVAQLAVQDLEDIDDAEVLVLITAAEAGVEGGGGRHVETGYALARGLELVVVGEPENVFHRLPAATHTRDWDAAERLLVDWAGR